MILSASPTSRHAASLWLLSPPLESRSGSRKLFKTCSMLARMDHAVTGPEQFGVDTIPDEARTSTPRNLVAILWGGNIHLPLASSAGWRSCSDSAGGPP